MRRCSVWLVVVVAALMVTAAPASAASLASINTTATDFQSASLDDMRIVGSGTEASVTGEVGYTDQVDSGSVTGDDIGTGLNMGVVFTVDSKKGAVWADPGDVLSGGADVIELRYQSNGTLIESTSVGSGAIRFGFEADLYPGTEYRLTARQSDGGLVFDQYAQGPVTSGDLTLVRGHAGGSKQSTLVAFESVSVGNASDLSFVGPEHTAQAKSLFANVSTSGPVTVTAQANSGSGWTNVTNTTITASQNVSLDISGSSATRYRTVVEASDKESERSVTVHDEGVTFDASSPSLSNPDPADGATDVQTDGDISVNLTDADFGLPQSDVVRVEAVDGGGGTIGMTDATANGTVSFAYTPSLGDNNITWTATDDYGQSTTLQQDFATGEGLTIYNESAPDQKITNATVEVTFFGTNTTVTRNTSNGIVSFAGLPGDEAFIAEVEAEQYRSRTIIIPSLLQQQSVWLLPENTTAVQVRFVLDDSTGTFNESSVLYIDKPINQSGTLQYQTVVSDRFGTDGVTVYLEQAVRYDLRVRAQDGTTSQLGNFDGELNETVQLQPSAAAVEPPDGDSGINYSATYDADVPAIGIEYSDPAGLTDSLTISVVKQDGTVIRPQQTYVGTSSLSLSEPLGSELNQTAYVYINGTRDGQQLQARIPVGPQQQNVVPSDLDQPWPQIGAGVLLLLVGGLFSRLNVNVGALVTSLFAGVLWYLGVLGGLASGAAVALAIGLTTLNLMVGDPI